jgi:energy-coupling factor transporter ATP-binding protein EcfA2
VEYLRPEARRARSKLLDFCRGFRQQSGIWVSVQIWMLDPSNLLLMDEPTTHLDIGSIDALIASLQDYEGTLIFISHDIHFIRAMACSVLHIGAGKLTPYAGDLNPYKTSSSILEIRHFSRFS